jgi:hypothetical protein
MYSKIAQEFCQAIGHTGANRCLFISFLFSWAVVPRDTENYFTDFSMEKVWETLHNSSSAAQWKASDSGSAKQNYRI